jgi:hypothetical protein
VALPALDAETNQSVGLPRSAVNMGIQGLTKLLQDEAPDCIKEQELELYTGRKVAIDASMALYSFMVRGKIGSPHFACDKGAPTYRYPSHMLHVDIDSSGRGR